jgi:thioredoxin reductase
MTTVDMLRVLWLHMNRMREFATSTVLPTAEVPSQLQNRVIHTRHKRPVALWRHATLRKRFAASQEASSQLVALLPAECELRASQDVIIIGAGLTGLSIGVCLAASAVDLSILERKSYAGGVWAAYASPFSRVNSTEPGYRLRLKHRRVPNTNHSHQHEILTDCMRALQQCDLADRTFYSVDVSAVERTHLADGCYRVACSMKQRHRFVACQWTILCTNRRLGPPRNLTIAGAEGFAGQIRRGLAGDICNLDWKGLRVLILGHGPYAIETARTSLEHAGSHATFAVRRHGLICPEMIDYVNYIRSYDDNFAHPARGSAEIVLSWQAAYADSSATPPEVWARGSFVPDGHTVSVSVRLRACPHVFISVSCMLHVACVFIFG